MCAQLKTWKLLETAIHWRGTAEGVHESLRLLDWMWVMNNIPTRWCPVPIKSTVLEVVEMGTILILVSMFWWWHVKSHWRLACWPSERTYSSRAVVSVASNRAATFSTRQHIVISICLALSCLDIEETPSIQSFGMIYEVIRTDRVWVTGVGCIWSRAETCTMFAVPP